MITGISIILVLSILLIALTVTAFISTAYALQFKTTLQEAIKKKCRYDAGWIFMGRCNKLPDNENDVYAISARGQTGQNSYHPDSGYNTQGSGYNYGYKLSDISKLYSNCPPEIAIIVHGFSNNQYEALEKFDRAKQSLDRDGYKIPVIGFSWDSNPVPSQASTLDLKGQVIENAFNWVYAKPNADKSGINLAKFILDFKNRCNSTDIRIAAHSLGTRVVESALINLNNHNEWKADGFKIRSVHFLGAAIPNQDVDRNGRFGQAIENQVGRFYNLYSSTDDILSDVYTRAEKNNALGQKPIASLPKPTNYIDTSVKNELKAFCDADGDGSCDFFLWNIRPKFGITGTDFSFSQNMPLTRKASEVVMQMPLTTATWTTSTTTQTPSVPMSEQDGQLYKSVFGIK
jgi:hypothetical protein